MCHHVLPAYQGIHAAHRAKVVSAGQLYIPTYTGLAADTCLPPTRLPADACLLLLGLAGGATHNGVPGVKRPWSPGGALVTRCSWPTLPRWGDSRDDVRFSFRRERWGDKPRRVVTPSLEPGGGGEFLLEGAVSGPRGWREACSGGGFCSRRMGRRGAASAHARGVWSSWV